ncbi:MAG: hypothetical protein Q7S01_00480, partial [bacterium]|nr:hypothetical protein [bacterium]
TGNTTLANATTTNLFSTTASSTNLFSQLATIGTLTLNNILGISSGGTGQTSFGQGWLSSDGSALSASTSPTVNYIVATSTTVSNIFASTTTAPYLGLSALGAAGSPALTFTGDSDTGIWSSGANVLNFSTGGSERVRIDSNGYMGIGTTTPWLALSVKSPNAGGQFVASYDDSTYATLAVDATGDLKFTANGGDIRALSENLWICDNGACPTLTATSTAGNVFVENAITFGNGFSIASTTGSTSELGLYNGSGNLMLIFDDGA